VLSRVLGHSSVVVTETYYAHIHAEDVIALSRRVRLPIARRPRQRIVSLLGRGDAIDPRSVASITAVVLIDLP
jgi:hypothetical protein